MRVKTRIFIIISISLTATSIVGDFFNKNSSYQIENNENTIYQSPLCGCKKAIPIGESNSDKGVNWCSKESTMRGPHQSVVTYSLFGEATRMGPVYKYFRLLNTISKQIGHFYPGNHIDISLSLKYLSFQSHHT